MELELLKEQGYEGFVSIGKLMSDNSFVPNSAGVYIVLVPTKTTPVFLAVGTGGHFKQRNPNVTIEELKSNWVGDSHIVYIGKATSLKKRLKQYMEFGQGKPVGHWGGRLIWQLADVKDFLVCWHTYVTEKLASDTESELIQKFKVEHNGHRPFANLRD